RVARPREAYCSFCSEQRGRYGAVVNADGTLFSCWDAAGRPGHEVGSVTDGYGAYTADRWVRCGETANTRPVTAFMDELDAGLLDLIRDRSRLASKSGAGTATTTTGR